MTQTNCRIYPNGEFSIWEERPNLAVVPAPAQPDYLGLSLVPNSHKIALGMIDPPAERAKRGLRGISRLGARTVRNAAFLLEERYGKKHLGFYTFTLPPLSSTAEYAIALEWPEIVRQFLQAACRMMTAAGLPTSYVSCSEIQEKRYRERGGFPLHLHVVMVGRQPFKTWAISSDQWRALWRRAVCNRCPEYENCSWGASVDTVAVRGEIGTYLGKYMSKGVAGLSAILAEDPGLAEFVPASWWNCSLALKRAIGARMAGGLKSSRKILADIRAGDTRIASSREIKIDLGDGMPVTVAIVGRLSPEGRKKYAWRAGGIIGIDAGA